MVLLVSGRNLCIILMVVLTSRKHSHPPPTKEISVIWMRREDKFVSDIKIDPFPVL
jgi:hypothetical protein